MTGGWRSLRGALRGPLLGPLLGTTWLLSLFAPLLSPDRVLANRDVGIFHLPLRLAFRQLAALGLPVWNPWLNGGQPILSNPSYGAFYPPSWLAFVVPPHYALSLMTVLHVALAFAGAWRLARRLGCGRGAAALAAIGFSGCGAFLSLLALSTSCGAWPGSPGPSPGPTRPCGRRGERVGGVPPCWPAAPSVSSSSTASPPWW